MTPELEFLFMGFAGVAVVLMIAALVLRIVRRRLTSKILIVISCAFLIAYSCQFIVLSADVHPFTAVEYGYISLFIFSILISIYELTTIFSWR